MLPPPTWQTFVGFFLAALGAAIGWSLGNVFVTLTMRAMFSGN